MAIIFPGKKNAFDISMAEICLDVAYLDCVLTFLAVAWRSTSTFHHLQILRSCLPPFRNSVIAINICVCVQASKDENPPLTRLDILRLMFPQVSTLISRFSDGDHPIVSK